MYAKQTMELAIPAEHQDFARAMVADILRAERENLATDLDYLDPHDAEKGKGELVAEITEHERQIQRLEADGTLTGTPDQLHEQLTYEVNERWGDDEDWRDPAVVAWLGCCVGLVRDLLADPAMARPRAESHGRHTIIL